MKKRTLLLIGLLFLFACVVTNWAAPAKKTSRITLSKATTRVTGPLTKDGYVDYPRVINQRLSVGITAENNANVLLWKAMGPHPEQTDLGTRFFEAMKTEMPPEKGDYFLDLRTFVKQELKLKLTEPRWDKITEQQGEALFHPWTAEKYPELAGWLKINEKPLAVVKEATLRPRYFSPLIIKPDGEVDAVHASLIAVLLPGVQVTRSFARALSVRAMLHLANNRHEQAWDDILSCHRLGRLVAEGPTLIEALVGIAICSIATEATLTYIEHAKPDATTSAQHTRQLRSILPLPHMADHIDLCERFIYLDVCQRLAGSEGNYIELIENLAGNPNPNETRYSRAIKNFYLRLTDWDLVLKNGNEAYDQIVTSMRLEDPAARDAAMEAFERSIDQRGKQLQSTLNLIAKVATSKSAGEGLGSIMGDIMITLLVPALSACHGAESRALQIQDNLEVALALSRYHAENGEYPPTLPLLAPKHIKQLPIDRFSGKALIYRRSEQGYLFYSVGRNKKDEQGRFYDDQPQGDDLRVQMPRKQD